MRSKVTRNCEIKRRRVISRYILLGLLIGVAACSDDPFSGPPPAENVTLLVVNEGNFSDSNGSFTRYDLSNGTPVQSLFEQVNARPLGGIVQTAVLEDDRLYIVLNNSDKIEIAEAGTMQSIATVEFGEHGITPAGFARASDQKGYVSDLFGNRVSVVDLEGGQATGTHIAVGNNPGSMVVVGNRLFVADNGFGAGNTISVIDTESDELVTQTEVGAGPFRLLVDLENRVWVASSGYKAFDEEWNRDPENDISGRVDLLGSQGEWLATIETGGFPRSVEVDLDLGLAWVVNEGFVQQISLPSLELSPTPLIGRDFRSIALSPTQDRLFLAQSRGFTQSGQTIVYDLEGAAVDSFQTGIAPSEFHFRVAVE